MPKGASYAMGIYHSLGLRLVLSDTDSDSVTYSVTDSVADSVADAVCADCRYSRSVDRWEHPTNSFDQVLHQHPHGNDIHGRSVEAGFHSHHPYQVPTPPEPSRCIH